MSMQDIPAGPGPYTRRNDLGNVKKIQREGRNISEAPAGKYGEGRDLKNINKGATTQVPSATPSGNLLASSLPPINLLQEGNPEVPLSTGAQGGPGEGRSARAIPFDDMNEGEALARAMYLANPTPQLARIVDAYNQQKFQDNTRMV
jgi:hypothetical protein